MLKIGRLINENFLKVSANKLNYLMNGLKEDFPSSTTMWYVAKEIQEGRMKANLFADEWPNFTTVISQELTPRLSDVADIRIYTREKEKVMDIINGANLLEGNSQWIICHTRNGDSESFRYLHEAISKHPAMKDAKDSLMEYDWYIAYTGGKNIPCQKVCHKLVPPGYVLDYLKPEHAEFVAEKWDFYPFPLNNKIKFLRELFGKYSAYGAFTADEPSLPVSWMVRKKGGALGIGYTLAEHRKKNLHQAVMNKYVRDLSLEGFPTPMFEVNAKLLYEWPHECIGKFHALSLSK